MPGIDLCQEQVERALNNIGWRISRRQIYFPYKILGSHGIYVDLEVINSAGQRLYIEIKCFLATGQNEDVFRAIGQCIMYQAIMGNQGDPTPLYLTLPFETYAAIGSLTQKVLHDLGIRLILVNLDEERIVQWLT